MKMELKEMRNLLGLFPGTPSQPVASTVINFQDQQNPSLNTFGPSPRNPASSAGDSYGSPQSSFELPRSSYGSPKAPLQSEDSSSSLRASAYNGPRSPSEGNYFNTSAATIPISASNTPRQSSGVSYGSPKALSISQSSKLSTNLPR